MSNVVKFLSTRSFFQLGAELKREKYDHTGKVSSGSRTDRSMTQALWIAFFITFVFFIWAVYALIKYQSVLPGWVVILGILLLFAPAGPLLTLILVYYSVGAMKDLDVETDVTETVTIAEGSPESSQGPPADDSGGRMLHSRPMRSRSYYTHSRPFCRTHSPRRKEHPRS